MPTNLLLFDDFSQLFFNRIKLRPSSFNFKKNNLGNILVVFPFKKDKINRISQKLSFGSS